MPGVAPIVAERLGLDTAAAFDVQGSMRLTWPELRFDVT
jgi:hypothetical protein